MFYYRAGLAGPHSLVSTQRGHTSKPIHDLSFLSFEWQAAQQQHLGIISSTLTPAAASSCDCPVGLHSPEVMLALRIINFCCYRPVVLLKAGSSQATAAKRAQALKQAACLF
jgi:hypothetical protein